MTKRSTVLFFVRKKKWEGINVGSVAGLPQPQFWAKPWFSKAHTKHPTVTQAQSLQLWPQRLLSLDPFTLYIHTFCCGLVTCRMCLYVCPKRKNFLLNSISSLFHLVHPYSCPGSILIAFPILELRRLGFVLLFSSECHAFLWTSPLLIRDSSHLSNDEAVCIK